MIPCNLVQIWSTFWYFIELFFLSLQCCALITVFYFKFYFSTKFPIFSLLHFPISVPFSERLKQSLMKSTIPLFYPTLLKWLMKSAVAMKKVDEGTEYRWLLIYNLQLRCLMYFWKFKTKLFFQFVLVKMFSRKLRLEPPVPLFRGVYFSVLPPPPPAKIWPNDTLGKKDYWNVMKKGGKMHILSPVGKKYAYFYPNWHKIYNTAKNARTTSF